jgi:cytosine/adenosine deaminase-related metal-dependent hydrolase
MSVRDAFEEAYSAGVPRRLAAVRQAPKAPAKGRRPGAVSPKARPTQAAVALGGVVIAPDQVLTKGWVVVENGVIKSVTTRKPAGVMALATDGVILPGLIDLHGHPEFNVFAPWEPPKTFINRGQWRGDPLYQQLVRDPWNQLTKGGTSASVKKGMTRYAEVRAVVAGVTAIQGASKDYPNKAEALVRNVDLLIFGSQVARSTVDFDRLRPDDIDSIERSITAGTTKAHYIHLAEGQKSNQASINEFLNFTQSPLFGPATVMIHGTALDRSHFGQLADAGGKLVWSPQSNLRLYNETTDIAAALDAKLPIALGADWMPSGSPSLLHEMKVAARYLAENGIEVSNKQLVEMVTSVAADIAGLGDKLGRLEPGRAADLLVLQRPFEDAHDSVVAAYPSSVELVMIGGDIIYGRADLVRQLTTIEGYEVLIAWGREMGLDTRFGSPEVALPSGPPLRLLDISRQLIGRYPAIGPIFA